MKRWCFAIGMVSVLATACSDRGGSPTAPTSASVGEPAAVAAGLRPVPAGSEQPPFNLEAILRGDGFGLVKFRQAQNPTQNIVNLDVWVRDVLANTSPSPPRATASTIDGGCPGTNWLTLGEVSTPHPIVTDGTGTARVAL